ncbi:MAG: RsmB/NOP family class I SAM-dependent RNA methyltransferase [Cyclobacteriaceae bacterium]
MRLYRNLCEGVLQSLQSIFEDNRYADKVIEKTFKQNIKWGSRDRRFVAEAVYGIVRWYRFLQEVSGASKEEYWKLLATWLIWQQIKLPDWDEFKKIDQEAIQASLKEKYPTKIVESIPDWLAELGEKSLGNRWETELSALNQEAVVVLRANTLKISPSELQEKLQLENVASDLLEDFPDALQMRLRQNVFRTLSFKEGLFEVQDAGSQLIAPFLQIEPGMRVIDACAGAGGKTLHLATLAKNKGRIVALDTEQWKLDELKKRARRAGANNIEARVIESSKTIKRLAKSADRLLLDVPCSGLGVLKRNPDAKWKLNLDFIEKVKVLQQKILSEYCEMLKPGGLLVYSTCSILPSENEDQVQSFLSSRPGEFELNDERHVWPSEGFDGFYMALLRKK